MLYKKELPIRYETDVFVAGGGPAGIAAALAASRNGASVFLAEARGSFGGVGASGLVPAFAQFGDGVNILASGIGYDIRKSISKDIPLDVHWCMIRVEELKRAYDEAMSSSNAEFSFFTSVCDVVTDGDRIEYVVLTSKSGMFAVKAKIYIDCTGDGDLCALAGADYEIGDEKMNTMPPTLCSLWANIDFSKKHASDSSRLEEAIADGVFTYADRHLPGMFPVDEQNGIGGGNIGHIFGTDPLDEHSLTRAMIWGRKSLLEYERYYKNYLEGFEKMTLVCTADMLGVRESRRIKCDYMLKISDFADRAVFDDEIGRYCYAVDIHVMTTDKSEYERFKNEYDKKYCYKDGESYGIPYRSLLPQSLSNVLVAGRCIGADRHMQASVRVMPGCFITGQAAGVAASIAKDTENTRSVDIALLQQKLASIGAYLPNRK